MRVEVNEDGHAVPQEKVTVSELEQSVVQQFQDAAFKRYQQSIITFGTKLWREARSVAHQRDPDVDLIEITTPDVDTATARMETKLARLRQLKFPFRLVQQIVTLITGIAIKTFFDLANLPQSSCGREFIPVAGGASLGCVVGILILNYLEFRAELLR